ncbi:surface lipoprotein assembly modifier [Tropicimonas aquimaris]|uniref:Surface lipoprotein assembly modifier n=1 Tax=Tropicimonas aquimaris TaxID=914152 RepID=A0ABW3IRX1_9RHOB
MNRRTRHWLCAMVGASLYLGSAGLVASEDVSLTPEQMRAAAHMSLQTRQPRQGLALAEALLKRDPEDVDALILKSQALRDLGQYDDALDAARTAYRLADTEAEIFAAAMVRAQALASKGARTRAQAWLRIAGENAPDDEARAVAVRDFRYLRKRNPWNTQLSFSVAPTSNVNDGTTHDRISYGGLQGVEPVGISRPLSGLSYSGSLTTRYRFSQSDTHETSVGLHLFGQSYILSDEAKDIAPDASGSDFAYTSVAVGLVHEWEPEAWSTPVQFSLLTGRGWYGQEDYSRYTRAGVAKPFILGKSTVLRLDAGAESFERLTDDAESFTLSGNAVLLHELDSGAALRFGLGLFDTQSDTGSLQRDRIRGEFGYTLAKPFAGARVTLEAGLEQIVYDEFPQPDYTYFPIVLSMDVERKDLTRRVGVSLWFEDIDYYGFSPTITLSHEETSSTLDLYDTVETGLNFGFRSSF